MHYKVTSNSLLQRCAKRPRAHLKPMRINKSDRWNLGKMQSFIVSK